jgi:hypothetical protein
MPWQDDGMGEVWTPVLNGIPAPGNTYVLMDDKLLYVSNTKAACTSLRWMVADLAGEDKHAFYATLNAQQSRLMTIHGHRRRWHHTPQLFQIPAEERAAISRDNGWLIFTVVRDPWSRLFSAWQSKFLVRHAYYLRHYDQEEWFPRVPSRAEDVIEDFHAFVFAAPWLTHPLLSQDVHFKPQVSSVRPQGINYSKIYDLTEMPTLVEDIHRHLTQLGKDRELYLPRANETPLTLIPQLFEDGVAEEIEKLYQPDLEAFGDRWSIANVRTPKEMWTRDAIRHAAFHTVANERLGDLSKHAKQLERSLRQAERELTQLEAGPSRRPARSVAAAVKERATHAVQRVRAIRTS